MRDAAFYFYLFIFYQSALPELEVKNCAQKVDLEERMSSTNMHNLQYISTQRLS